MEYMMQNMVFIFDCNWKRIFKKIHFATDLDINKCLKQIRLMYCLHMCTHFSELPFNISTKMNIYRSIIFGYWKITKVSFNNKILLCRDSIRELGYTPYYKSDQLRFLLYLRINITTFLNTTCAIYYE